MKFRWIGLSVLACGILVGCTEDESGGDKKLSDEYVESAFDKLNKETSSKLPENVLNGTVTEEIFKETVRYVTDFQAYDKHMFSFLDRLNKDSSLYDDPSFIEEYKESMDAYEVFIKGFHLSPKTEADFELEANLSNILLNMSYVISGLRQYINTKETHHVSSLEEYMSEVTTSYEALSNSIKKFKLDSK